MHWIVQNNIYSEEGHTRLLEALDRHSFSYSLHKCVPFIGTLDPEAYPPQGKVIVMGSYTLAQRAKERGWTPGAFVNDNFDYELQVKRWGDQMLNADAWFGTLEDVSFQYEPFFIRPIQDTKDFCGTVMDQGSFDEWKTRVLALTPEDGATMSAKSPVMVCKKKEVYREVRTWVVKDEIVTASQYKVGNGHRPGFAKYQETLLDDPLVVFARACTVAWPSFCEAYCLDVADTSDGMKIVEVNNLNSSGFYAADMAKLVEALEKAFG